MGRASQRLLIMSALVATLVGCNRVPGRETLFVAPGLETQTRNPGVTTTGAIGQKPASPAMMTYYGGTQLGPPSPGVKVAPSGQVSIDLEDADIATAAKAVLGDVLKANYGIDQRVQGKVTLKTGKPLPAAQALSMFESALAQNGIALVENQGSYSIVPSAEVGSATSLAIRSSGGGAEGPGFGVRAVQLKNISAVEMAEILSPIAKDVVVRIDKERNALVLQGTGAQFNAAMETIRTFDVDWLSNKSVGVFRLTNTSADAVSKTLQNLLQNDNIDATMARFIALDTNNTVIAVAKTPQILGAVRRWIARLDQAGGSSLRMFTYEMRFARASDAGPLVGSALGIQAMSSSALTGGGSGTSRFADRSGSNSGSSSSGRNTMVASAGKSMPASGGNAPTSGTEVTATTVDPARAVLEQGLKRGDGTAGPALPGGEGGTGSRIVIDEASNKLLVYGTAEQFEKVKDAMRTIDVPQKQVLVEATFVEVQLNDNLRYGVQYYLNKVVNGTSISAKLTPNEDGTVGMQSPGGSLKIGMNTQAIIDALSGITRVNVISSPNLMVMNNQPARLVVGDQVPVSTQSRTDPFSSTNVTVSSIEFRDTGIIFDVTPHISASGSVTLDILQEVSSVKNTVRANTLTPTISQRRVTSTVVANNNETVVIGGLFAADRQQSRSGLPVLMKVPVLGGLLSQTENSDSRTELMVLISPKIINDKNDARAVTRELSDRITDLRLIDMRHIPRLPPPAPAPAPAHPPCKPGTSCVSAKY